MQGVVTSWLVLCLGVEWSRFEPWVGTLCSVFRENTLLSQCLYTQLQVQVGIGKLGVGL